MSMTKREIDLVSQRDDALRSLAAAQARVKELEASHDLKQLLAMAGQRNEQWDRADALSARVRQLEEALREVRKDVARAAVNNVVWPDTMRMIDAVLSVLPSTPSPRAEARAGEPTREERLAEMLDTARSFLKLYGRDTDPIHAALMEDIGRLLRPATPEPVKAQPREAPLKSMTVREWAFGAAPPVAPKETLPPDGDACGSAREAWYAAAPSVPKDAPREHGKRWGDHVLVSGAHYSEDVCERCGQCWAHLSVDHTTRNNPPPCRATTPKEGETP